LRRKSTLLIVFSLFMLLLFTSCQSLDGKEGKSITVSARGEVTLVADYASFSVSVDEVAATTKEAQQNANAKMAAVRDILEKEFSSEAEDFKTTAMQLSPEYTWKDGEQKLVGQRAYQSIKVEVEDLSRLGEIVDSLSAVEGISFSSINLDKKDKSEAIAEAQWKAIEEARKKAGIFASAAGLTLSDALIITESGSDYTPYLVAPAAMKMYAEAAVDNSAGAEYFAGDITVSSSVTVVFEMI